MKAFLSHATFAAILASSIAVREVRDDPMPASSLEAAVIEIARSEGWTLRETSPVVDTAARALTFAVPGCADLAVVLLVTVTLEDDTLLPRTAGSHSVRRYIYLDRSWNEPDRVAVSIERLKHKALTVFGWTRFMPSQWMLIVESAANCRAADAMDWRVLWERSFVTGSETDPGRLEN